MPTVEAFVKECRTCSVDFDIMGMRGTYHTARVHELVEKFKMWRDERVPGVRAFQSTYDRSYQSAFATVACSLALFRVGITVCKWLFQIIHDTEAISVFDSILPLMASTYLTWALYNSFSLQPEIFRFTEGAFTTALHR